MLLASHKVTKVFLPWFYKNLWCSVWSKCQILLMCISVSYTFYVVSLETWCLKLVWAKPHTNSVNWYFECRGCLLFTHWHLPPWLLRHFIRAATRVLLSMSGHSSMWLCIFCLPDSVHWNLRGWVIGFPQSQCPLYLCFDHNLSLIICQLRGLWEWEFILCFTGRERLYTY